MCVPPQKTLQFRCPPEHLRSSTFATFMEFVIHPVDFRTNVSPSMSQHLSPKRHRPPTTLTTPDTSRISRIIHKPRLLTRAGCSCRKNFSPSICFLYNSHTQKSGVAFPHVPASSIAQNPSTSSAVLKMLRNVGIHRVRVTFLQSDTHGFSCSQLSCSNHILFEGTLQCRIIIRPEQKISVTCVSV